MVPNIRRGLPPCLNENVLLLEQIDLWPKDISCHSVALIASNSYATTSSPPSSVNLISYSSSSVTRKPIAGFLGGLAGSISLWMCSKRMPISWSC